MDSKSNIVIGEFERHTKDSLCFTSRQIKGLRILEEVIDRSNEITEKQGKSITNEISQIKYVIEKNIMSLKSKKYKEFLLTHGKML